MANNKNLIEKQPARTQKASTTSIPAIWPEKSLEMRIRLPKTGASRMSIKKNLPVRWTSSSRLGRSEKCQLQPFANHG